MIDSFPDEASCERRLQSVLWRDSEYCPHCGNVKIYHLKGGKRFRCAGCKKDFSIKTGTIFHDSKISLRKWFFAIYIVTTHKKSMSSYQLARDLQVTQKTAFYMLHRIREAVSGMRITLFLLRVLLKLTIRILVGRKGISIVLSGLAIHRVGV